MTKKHFFMLFFLQIVLTSSYAEEVSDSVSKKKPIGIDFFAEVQSISNLKEKDGNIFFTLGKPDKETNTYPRDLYQLINGKAVRLTYSENVSNYFFWEDEIVFQNIRDEKDRETIRKGNRLTVFQKLSPKGFQEATEWLRLPFAAGQIQWIDKEHFFYSSSYNHHKEDDKNYRILDELPYWSNGRGDISGQRTHLYYYDNGKTTLLTDTLGSSSGFELSPDKKTLIYTNKDAYYGKLPKGGNHLIALDVATLAKKEIALPDKTSGGGVQFLNDDEIILSIRSTEDDEDDGPSGIYRLHLKTGKLSKIFDGVQYSLGNSIGSDVGGGGGGRITFDDEGIRTVITDVDHAPLIHVDYKDAKVTFLTKGKETIQEYLPYKDGFLVVALIEQQGSEIYFLDKEGALSPLSSINKQLFEEHNVVKPIEITFTNEDGRNLNGFVLPPADYQKGKKYPAILDVHGGPRSAYGTVFFHEMQYWANQGYAVLFTNPTGSTGRGASFAEIKGKYGTVDYNDVMSFVDAALQQTDFIDENRLGITGGSYGGFMSNWAIGHTDRFKAAVSQRSIASWFSISNSSDIGHTFTLSNIGADAWTNSERLWEQSPLKYADKVKTPTLILHSDQDYRTPLWDGLQMYYALQYFNVPTRMVIFKGENHNLSRSGKPENRIKRLAEITGWFDKYLKP
jgi:dipeptidyl aminopeptidase/acylaminoacyl peptidase